jgi:hypothetical protein
MKRVLVDSYEDRYIICDLGYQEVSTSRKGKTSWLACFLVPKEDIPTLKELVTIHDIEN